MKQVLQLLFFFFFDFLVRLFGPLLDHFEEARLVGLEFLKDIILEAQDLDQTVMMGAVQLRNEPGALLVKFLLTFDRDVMPHANAIICLNDLQSFRIRVFFFTFRRSSRSSL